MMYIKGEGVEKDFEKGFDMLQQSAKEGNAEAMLCLAEILYKGEHIKQDKRLAIKYLTKAVSLDNPGAQRMLAELTLAGDGVNQNLRKAAKLYSTCANSLDEDIPEMLEKIRKTIPDRLPEFQKILSQLVNEGYPKAETLLKCLSN